VDDDGDDGWCGGKRGKGLNSPALCIHMDAARQLEKNFDVLDRLSRLMPPRRIIPWPYIHAEWHLS